MIIANFPLTISVNHCILSVLVVIVQYKLVTGKKEGEHMIILDYKDTRPIYEQVVEKFKLLILKGVLQKDEQMPSVRSLAVELSINPNTIQKAYAELERQGFIYTVKGRGSFVLGDSSLVEQRRKEYLDQIIKLVKELLEIGMTKMEIVLEIENLQV